MNAPPRAVVTGSQGFVGRQLVQRLGPAVQVQALPMGGAQWRRLVDEVPLERATIYHLAARVHDGHSPEAAFMHDNVEKTEVLARRAARAGARRLVFASTVKVLGEETSPGRPFDARSDPAPQDAYGRSKAAAEEALARIARETGLDVAIVRAPLVYGRGAGGNLASLARVADSPWPLPLGGIDNRRSFVHVDDLCELLVACGREPSAARGTWLAAHRDAPSTSRIVAGLRRALGRPERLFPVPRALLEAGGARLRRLTRSLEVDASATCDALGWEATRDLDQALRDLAAGIGGGRS